MKKIKLNLDKQAIQDFFLQHVEKIVLALVVVCFFLLVYRAIGRETYERTPAQLKTAAEQADTRIDATKPESGLEVPAYREMVEKTAGQIGVDFYQHARMWRPPIHDPPPKRGEPLLETVQDLRGTFGYGPVRSAVVARGHVGHGSRDVSGERFIILTGLVPYEDQVKDYVEAFKHAAQQNRRAGGGVRRMGEGGPPGAMSASESGIDVPLYVHYHVQKVEVASADDVVDEAQWEQGSIHVLQAKREASRLWPQGGANYDPRRGAGREGMVLPNQLIAALDFPMPPLVDGWELGDAMAHPPEIPLYVPPQVDPLNPSEMPGPVQPPEEGPAPDRPDADQPPDMPGGIPGGAHGGERGMVPGMMPGEEGMPGMGVPGAFGEGFGVPGMPGMPGGTPVVKDSPYRLLRFVDRTVEPGKHYRYRVRLMLVNPNYGRPLRDLDRIELARDKFITTDWSEPTGVIDVPRDDRVLALSVKASVRAAYEPTAKVALIKWLNEEGIEADQIYPNRKDSKAYRGQLLNLAKCEWPEPEKRPRPRRERRRPNPGAVPGMEGGEGGLFGEMSPEMAPPGAGEMAVAEVDTIEVDYETEALLLDIRGGARVDLAGNANGSPPSSTNTDLNAPGEVLLLDVNGQLVIHRELEDCSRHEAIQERANPPSRESMMGPGEGGLFGEMPGELMEAPPMEGGSPRGRRR